MSDRLAQLKSDAERDGWLRYVRSENDERALLAGYKVNAPLGQHVVDFFAKFLRHFKGRWAGQPFILNELQVHEIVIPLFGWVRPDGRRRFTSAEIWVPKKNFKSTLSSGFAVYGFLGDGEAGAEVYCAANDRDQAGIVFRAAADMVEASPQLSAIVDVTRSTKTMRNKRESASWLKALSAEHATAEGLNAHFLVIDEIHAFDERGRLLYDALRYSGAARLQPMSITISTAGENEISIGYECYTRAKRILDGHDHDLHTFAFIREAEASDDPASPATWAKANPMFGETIQGEELAEQWEKSKTSPRAVNAFKRYRLNIWQKTSEPWLPMDAWVHKCGGLIDRDSLAGRTCWGGIDLGIKHDLSAWSLIFPDDEGDTFTLLTRFWLPGDDIINKEHKDRVPYREWADCGWLTLTDGDVADHNKIIEDIVADSQEFGLIDFGFDPAGANTLAQILQDDHGLTAMKFRQGPFTMTEPCKRFEELVIAGKLRHGDNPVLRAQASQVALHANRGGLVMPVKGDGKQTWYRIDGIVSAVMALGRSMEADIGVYETSGVFTIDSDAGDN